MERKYLNALDTIIPQMHPQPTNESSFRCPLHVRVIIGEDECEDYLLTSNIVLGLRFLKVFFNLFNSLDPRPPLSAETTSVLR